MARVLPDLWLPPSGYTVTPVIGYWSVPAPVWASGETSTPTFSSIASR